MNQSINKYSHKTYINSAPNSSKVRGKLKPFLTDLSVHYTIKKRKDSTIGPSPKKEW